MNPITLPASPDPWKIHAVGWYGNSFLVFVNPSSDPRLLGRTAQGQVFMRPLTEQEKRYIPE